MFGYSIVRTEEIRELRRAYPIYQRVHQAYRWFSPWQDLDVIWDYLINKKFFGGVEAARKQYADLRNTDIYGKENTED